MIVMVMMIAIVLMMVTMGYRLRDIIGHGVHGAMCVHKTCLAAPGADMIEPNCGEETDERRGEQVVKCEQTGNEKQGV
jgi:hypothetical protein